MSTDFFYGLPSSEVVSPSTFNSKNKIIRYQKSNLNIGVISAAIDPLKTMINPVYFMYFHGEYADGLLIFGDMPKIVMYDTLTFTSSVFLDFDNPIPFTKGPITLYDKANKMELFASNDVKNVYRLTMTDRSTIALSTTGSLITQTIKIAGMRSVSTLKAFIVSFLDGSDFEFVQNFDLASMKIVTAPNTIGKTLIGSLITSSFKDNTLNLAMLYKAPILTDGGIQTYSVKLDSCTTRASGICTACPSGYYMNVVNVANNQCFRVSELGTGKGPDLINGGAYFCEEGCSKCDNNYKVCQECKSSKKLVVFSATSTRCLDTIPLGYGNDPDAITLYKPCSDNCDSCSSSIKVCEYCKDNFYLIKAKDTVDVTCSVTIPEGWGFPLAGKVYEGCTASLFCKTCPLSINKCSECATSTFYRVQIDANTIKCINDAGFNQKYGLNPIQSNRYSTACSDSNCDDCKAAYNDCTTCASTYTLFKQTSAATKTCIADASITTQNSQGWRTNTDITPRVVEPCSITGCTNCLESQAICKECAPGKYLHKDASNVYTCKAAKTAKYGLTDTAGFTNLYVPCDSSRCDACATFYKACTKCTDNTDLRIYKSTIDISCQATGTPPESFGKDTVKSLATDLLYVACSSPDCKKCELNFEICTECKTATNVLKQLTRDASTSKVICVDKATVETGYGFKTANVRIEPCTDTSCLSCSTSVAICQECATPKLLKYVAAVTTPAPLDAIYTCEASIAANSGYGLTIPDDSFIRVYQKCCTGCLECLGNLNKCTKCDTGYYRVQIDADTIECVSTTSYDLKFGRNKYLVPDVADLYFTACEQSACLLCVDNYESCTKCPATHVLVKLDTQQDVDTCVLIADAPCSIKGCTDCSGDKSKCKECDCSKYYLKRTGDASADTGDCVSTVPAQFGLVTPNVGVLKNAYAACEGRCASCVANVKMCDSCTDATDNRINKGAQGIICQAAATAIPSGYGKNEASALYYTACKYDNCEDCKDKYNVCKTCAASYVLLQLTKDANADVKCVLSTGVPKGYGLDTTTSGIAKPCSTVNCENCDKTDYNICEECATPKFLKFVEAVTTGTPTPAVYTCEDSIAANSGFGLTVPDTDSFVSVYQKCCTGCLECLGNVQKCTKCDTGYYRVQKDADNIECVSTTSYDLKFGRNKYLVPDVADLYFTACEQSACLLCVDNYESCTQCAATHVLAKLDTQQDVDTCVLIADAPCSIKGCKDCSGDKSKCKECDCNNYFLMRTGSSSPYTTSCVTELAEGFGYIIPDEGGLKDAVAACETRCADCFDNIKQCTVCKDVTDNRINKGDEGIICQATGAAIEVKYGLNKVDNFVNYYTACKYEHCTDCSVDYNVCKVCEANYVKLQLTNDAKSDVKCVPENNIPKTHGLDTTATGKLAKLCTVANCKSCGAADNTKCEECVATKFLKYTVSAIPGSPAVYTCEDSLTAVSEFGLTVPDANGYVKLYVACADGCSDCFGDTKICMKCKDTHYRLYRSATSITCETKTGFAESFGTNKVIDPLDVNILTKCQQAGCKTCLSDFESCSECTTSTDVLVKKTDYDILTCVVAASTPTAAQGFGVASTPVPHYAKCEMVGCIDCFADNKKCKECDSRHSLRNVAAAGLAIDAQCGAVATAASGLGIDKSLTNFVNLYVTCPTGCLECLLDKDVCTKCTTGYRRIFTSVSDIKCVIETTALPAKYGRNEDSDIDNFDQYFTPCKDTNCDACEANYRVCSACKAGYKMLKQQRAVDDVICVTTATAIDVGFGLNKDSGIIMQCYDTDCKTCDAADYKICMECDKLNLHVTRGTIGNPDVYVCRDGVQSGYGLVDPDTNSFLSLYEKCADGCSDCKKNNKVCNSCVNNADFRVEYADLDVRCVVSTTNVDGFGLNPIRQSSANDLFYTKCKYTSCITCKEHYAKCTACTDDSFTLVQLTSDDATSDIKCILDGENLIGHGYKENLVTMKPCATPNCISCPNDYLVCKECNFPKVLKFTAAKVLPVATLAVYSCEESVDKSSHYGLVVPNQGGDINKYAECAAGCDTCLENVKICTKCLDDSYYRVQINDNEVVCQKKDTFTGKFGRNKYLVPAEMDYYLSKCEQSSCLTCINNYESCDSCDAGYALVRTLDNREIQQCIINANKPQEGSGLGVVPGSNPILYDKCTLTGCKNCYQSNRVCKECYPDLFFQRNANGLLSCESSLTNGYGLKVPAEANLARLYVPCDAASKCRTCPNDYRVCTRCAVDANFRINKSATDMKCVTTVEDGYGRNTVAFANPDLYYSACSANCAKCQADVRTCTECKSGYTKVKVTVAGVDVICVQDGNVKAHTLALANSIASHSQECGVSGCKNCTGDSTACKECVAGKHLVTKNGKAKCQDIISEDGISELAITEADKIPVNPESEESSLMSSKLTLTNVLQYTLKLFGFAFKILLMPLDFFMSFTVDTVVSTFSYLKLLSSPQTAEANKIIDALSSRTLFGFTISNPYLQWASTPECKVSPSAAAHSLQCSLFYNYGHNLNILLAALILAIIVFVTTTIVLRFSKDQNSGLNKWMKVANYFFGVRYFFLFMHGVFLDVFGLIVLNMLADSSSYSAVGAGRSLSIALLAFYAVFYSVTSYSIKRKIDQLKAGQVNVLSPVLSHFSFLTDAFRFNTNQTWLLYMALFWPLKSAIAIIVNSLTRNSTVGHLVPVFTVELVALLVLIATRAKKRVMDNAFDIIFQLLLCVYIGTQAVFSGKDDLIDLQGAAVTAMMTVILYAMVIMTIIYLIFRAFVSIMRLKFNETIPNVLLPPVVESQEACILLDQSAAWTTSWK